MAPMALIDIAHRRLYFVLPVQFPSLEQHECWAAAAGHLVEGEHYMPHIARSLRHLAALACRSAHNGERVTPQVVGTERT